MFRLPFRAALLASAAALLAAPALRADDKPADKPARPKVEVVFCLDTTGSMKGLIKAAKEKIWVISNQIASGKPTPELKIGLVAYRDRGDEYITKIFDLTDDLDAVHGNLQAFVAKGGGDIPESVNQALDDAVHKIKWSDDPKVLKMIFLVGDAPPHMDYKDDVKYPVTCEKAVRKNILINTVQCGDDAECTKHWKEICKLAEGRYVAIPQDGGAVKVVDTPFDKDLTAINAELARSTVVYGSRQAQMESKDKADKAANLPTAEAAPRAGFQAKNAQAATYDLCDAIKQGKVKLEDLKDEELPDEMKKLSLKERKEYLDNVEKKRQALVKRAVELDKKRSDYIAEKEAEDAKKGKNSFDAQVLEVLRQQAKKNKIDY
jgi:Mg-chelatase subunit ChlD